MPPQVLDVKDFEAGVLSGPNDVVQAHNLAAGENSACNEQALSIALHRAGPRYPVIQEQAVGSQQFRNSPKIFSEVSAADVFEHADRSYIVEASTEIAIVHFAD